MSRQFFNFRDVMQEAGLESENRTNWSVGQIIRRAAKMQPVHLMTTKTNPEPSVPAPHMIAHYPMSVYPQCLAAVIEWVADGQRQIGLFEESE
jgi:hypothetical protein